MFIRTQSHGIFNPNRRLSDILGTAVQPENPIGLSASKDKTAVVHDTRAETEKKEESKANLNKRKKRRMKGDYIEFKV